MHLFFIDLNSCQHKVLHVTKQLRRAVIFHVFIQIRNHFLEEKKKNVGSCVHGTKITLCIASVSLAFLRSSFYRSWFCMSFQLRDLCFFGNSHKLAIMIGDESYWDKGPTSPVQLNALSLTYGWWRFRYSQWLLPKKKKLMLGYSQTWWIWLDGPKLEYRSLDTVEYKHEENAQSKLTTTFNR